MATQVKRSFLPAPALGPGRPRLVVTGFMGTGKTAAGQAAARLLHLPFVDLDALAVKVAGMDVAAIFASMGEQGFRQIERKIMEEVSRLSGVVIATGGGAVLHGTEFARLTQGAVVAVLTCQRDELLRRLGETKDRPLLGGDPGRAVDTLLAARGQAYASAGQPLDTTSLDIEETAAALADWYRHAAGDVRAVTLPVSGPEGAYPVLLRPRLIEHAGTLVRRILPQATRAAVVVDQDVLEPWGRLVASSMAESGLGPDVPMILPAGEAGKTAAAVADLWQRMRDRRMGREDVVVAVGGGGTLDVAGFAAATYARGVPLVNVPTTLLSMVDAGLGGKVGIDHAGVKNLVGTFHHPAAVLADPLVLKTLPARPLRAGLGECVKAAVVASPRMLDVLEGLPPGAESAPAAVGWIAEQAIRVKAAYVREDPFDRNLRHALNLGHTFGHAIETASDYRVLHGEAVAIGLIASARLGASLGVTNPAFAARLEALLTRLGLPTRPPDDLDPARMLDAFEVDKKRRGGEVAFVLPCPGGVDLVTGLDPARALAALIPEGALAG